LDKKIIQLILIQYNSFFVTYEIPPGIYSVKSFSEFIYTMGDYDGSLKTEFDDITKETKLTLTRFGSTFGTLRFNEKSFFTTL